MEQLVNANAGEVEQRERGDGPALARRTRRRSQGQSLVELALALPLLLLLMLGTIDLGRAFFDYIQMRNGAFEGARYGARMPADTSGITDAVMTHGVPADTTVTVTCSTGSCGSVAIGSDATITVVASRTFTPITTTFLQRYFGIGTWVLNASATMKVMT